MSASIFDVHRNFMAIPVLGSLHYNPEHNIRNGHSSRVEAKAETKKMEPETKLEPLPEAKAGVANAPAATPQADGSQRSNLPGWIFFGSDGLRAGWRVALFALLLRVLLRAVGFIAGTLRPPSGAEISPWDGFVFELSGVIALATAMAVMARVEHRRILDYNLKGEKRLSRFAAGTVQGFLALSALVGVLVWGGWMTVGTASIGTAQIARCAGMWACVFLLVGFMEEGTMRCYVQFTLARGINFWWALATVGGVCLYLLARARGNGAWGVYGFALAGLGPCFLLHLKRVESSGFWQAAWATSTFFAFGHTSNDGENWVGIFAVALIGFVFCASVKVTGSAWWAIGCHAAWDWGETFFYGTADSGMRAQGHFLTSAPAGAAFWSGGTDGPEGSVLAIPVILALLAAVVSIYRRRRSLAVNAPAAGEDR